jgi:hypothetical protein
MGGKVIGRVVQMLKGSSCHPDLVGIPQDDRRVLFSVMTER